MSQAHRPTWNPTLGRETKAGSQQISKLSLAQHTKLKFRQPGQNNSGDILRRDLKAELAVAERAANEKKRKAAGLPPLETISSDLRLENGAAEGGEEDEAVKRRKVLEEALEMDKDDSDDEDEGRDKGKGKAVDGEAAAGEDDDEDEDEDDDDDE